MAVDTMTTRSMQGCKTPTPGIRQAGRIGQLSNWIVPMSAADMALPSAFQEIGNIQISVWLREGR
jgi:hypothetical protein